MMHKILRNYLLHLFYITIISTYIDTSAIRLLSLIILLLFENDKKSKIFHKQKVHSTRTQSASLHSEIRVARINRTTDLQRIDIDKKLKYIKAHIFTQNCENLQQEKKNHIW